MFSKFQVTDSVAFRGPKMARGETTPASSELAMAREDVGPVTK